MLDHNTAVSAAPPDLENMSAQASIARVDLYSYDLTYVGGDYVMSGGRVIRSLSSTVARVETVGGQVGFGESCPLGANYLPAHSAGARAALEVVAPHVLGLDGGNPTAISRVMDTVLLGHPYAKSALDVACWDVFGHLAGRPVCDLLGGRQQDDFHLFFPISLDTPERMCAQIETLQDRGTARFQLKVGGDPFEDAARVRAVAEVIRDQDVVVADANCGWSVADAAAAARLMEGVLPQLFIEQPCRTYEECLQVRGRISLPMILDEVICDLQDLLRAWRDGALEGINLKINRVGGITPARLMRDVGEGLGLIVNIEDSWGGDLTSAAISHLAASAPAGPARMFTFMNDFTNEHVAGYEPRSRNGRGSAPLGPGLGVTVDEERLGAPFASFVG